MTREQVFWGWGEPGAGPSLSETAAGFLRTELGLEGGVVSRPVALEDVRLHPPALPAGLRERLEAIAPVRDDREALRASLEAFDGDILLTTGATSAGKEDYLPGLLAEVGELLVHGVNIRPASPLG